MLVVRCSAPAVRLPLTPAAYISFLALGAADRVYTRRLTGLRLRPEGAQFRGSVRHCAVNVEAPPFRQEPLQ